MKRTWWMIIFCFMTIMPVMAQDTCPELVQTAVELLDNMCTDTARNEVCYGNVEVAITALEDADIQWEAPGDITPITTIQSIRTSGMQLPDTWGIALMRIQANIPNSIPGQNVTFIMFGDVDIENGQSATLTATANGGINVRDGSSTSASILGGLATGDGVELLGRNEASDWTYFQGDDIQGWVFASLLDIDGDLSTLAIVPDDFAGTSTATPMQSFYLSTGVGDSQCNEAPDSGLLVQTPQGVGTIELTVNEVTVQLGSTVLLQSEAGNVLTIAVLEGRAVVTAFDDTQVVPAGAFTIVPIDSDLKAVGAPEPPQPYVEEAVITMPTASLEETIVIADSASEEAITISNNGFVGNWSASADPDGSIPTLAITQISDDTFDVVYIDPGASACSEDGSTEFASTGTTTGTLDDAGVLNTTVTFVCSNPEATSFGPFPLSYTYDILTDTISDSFGGSWTRS